MAKILVVEDHADSRDLVRLVLETEGYTITEASTAEDGVKLAKSESPDLILMDVSLAGKFDGLEATKMLREDLRFRKTPIIALTAHVLKQDKEVILSAGFDNYLSKPIIDFEEFKSRIAVWLKESVNGNTV
ncbi:MAG: response regulator [Acidobacteriota bacterium]|nr:response regulator [Acidobacteriota bacterium]